MFMETVTLTIDGAPVTVEKGKTVLQAAIEAGITVPYYCYHPGIGIDGSCRVCIVKIEKMPKLQTSCSTVCTEGMVVSTRTPEVVAARAGVFEFLLVNHPLDCPVCDKGGECPLQEFSYTFGPDQSRMEFPRREFDGNGVKADVDFGPTLMLNRNRCILCTRCVRFMRDVDADAQINIIDRGYHARLPVQVAAVGQPAGRRHHLHAVRERLQRHGLDQGQAGVGEGIAADPVHAAFQSRRQRLLDVRHRPLRVPLDRRRRASPQTAGANRRCAAAAGVVARCDGRPGAGARGSRPRES
jgi:ferredoxin